MFNKLRKLFKEQNYLLLVSEITLVFFLFYNKTFLSNVITMFESNPDLTLSFKILSCLSLVCLLMAIFVILFSYKYVLKPAFCLLFFVSSFASYSVDKYGIMFDTAMIQNVVETNVAEAKSYLSWSFFEYFFLLGILPSIILFKVKVSYPKSILRSFLYRISYFLALLLVGSAIVLGNYQQFSFIGRENRSIHRQFIPVAYIGSSIQYVKRKYFTKQKPYVFLGDDARLKSTTDKPKLFFLVVGETSRAKNQSALGYHRDTNKYTKTEKVFNFKNVSSCATATATSLPCMFSDLTRDTYTDSDRDTRDNALDIIKKAGADVIWLENDGGCKGGCDRIKNETVGQDAKKCNGEGDTCYDEVFLEYANNIANTAPDTDTLVVFHLIGSHGPKYYERYPDNFRVFTPDCNRADVENCKVEEVINSYDNTVLYTDYVIFQLIEILEEHFNERDVALLYISDHGESLGEKGLYLHGTPYALAPDEQTKIPMQLWLPRITAEDLKIDRACLDIYTKEAKLSHDNLFHTLLGLMQVITKEYDENQDALKKCYYGD